MKKLEKRYHGLLAEPWDYGAANGRRTEDCGMAGETGQMDSRRRRELRRRRLRRQRLRRRRMILLGCVCLGAILLLAAARFRSRQNSGDHETAALQGGGAATEAAGTALYGEDGQTGGSADQNSAATEATAAEGKGTAAEAMAAEDGGAATEAMAAEGEYDRIVSLDAGELAASGSLSGELADRLFYSSEIDDALLDRITGKSYSQNDEVLPSDLSYLRMLCCGPEGDTYVGEMIVNREIAEEVLEIFRELYEKHYPIERMVLVDNYGGDDEASMEDNNTSAFNYRTVSGSDSLSNHSYGLAIDLNPRYNPYVKQASDGSTVCQPENGRAFVDRNLDFEYKIDEDDLAYRLFTRAGFTWGGSWSSVKDYQHFEKELP